MLLWFPNLVLSLSKDQFRNQSEREWGNHFLGDAWMTGKRRLGKLYFLAVKIQIWAQMSRLYDKKNCHLASKTDNFYYFSLTGSYLGAPVFRGYGSTGKTGPGSGCYYQSP